MQSALYRISSVAGMVLKIWFFTGLMFAFLLVAVILLAGETGEPMFLILVVPGSLIGSLPALGVLAVGAVLVPRFISDFHKRWQLFLLMLGGILIMYGLGAFTLFYLGGELNTQWPLFLGIVAALAISVTLACYLARTPILEWLLEDSTQTASYSVAQPNNKSNFQTIPQSTMEQQRTVPPADTSFGNSSPILFKGIITGVMILLMMVPTLFISSLVQERKARQKAIVQEVSQRWAGAQKLTGLFLILPYETLDNDEKGRQQLVRRDLFILPEEMKVSSQMEPAVRKRSIYQVLLYHSKTAFSGEFQFSLPKDINSSDILWKDASICMGLSDIKGIGEKVVVMLGGQQYELAPGLPNRSLVKTGLSAPVDLSASAGQPIRFSASLDLKGSEQLHFIPFAGNSSYDVQSAWPSPSFDGNTLPAPYDISENGFHANWTFSKANLPFGTVLRAPDFNEEDFSFGVTMVQPADQYAKTERSVKYAILFIGLTFSLFLVVEIMQKKPVHPIQYVLIGIALSIFYTLLLSISEFIAFDYAYAIATLATVSLITLYAQSHFREWKVSLLFGTILTMLYSFAFVLVRLEDTALLVGSIGLFVILALVMYGTRKIRWYPGGAATA